MHYLHYDAPEGTITHKNLTSVNGELARMSMHWEKYT